MFSESTLNLLPNTALAALSNSLTGQALGAANALSAKEARATKLNGYNEIHSVAGGKTTVDMVKAEDTVNAGAEQVAGPASVAGLAQTLADTGNEAYDPATLPPGTTGSKAEIDDMNAELDSQQEGATDLSFQSKTLDLQKINLAQQMAADRNKMDSLTAALDQVNSVLQKRSAGELPNPVLNYEEVGAAIQGLIDDLRAGTPVPGWPEGLSEEQINDIQGRLNAASAKDLSFFEKFVKNNIIEPFAENSGRLDILAAQLGITSEVDVLNEDTFTTVFGPPVSFSGKFILSQDGLYYDSRQGGIPYFTTQKINQVSWHLRYASNKGGKGEIFDPENMDRFSETVFSYDYQEESPKVLDFYMYDDVLRALRNDRDLRVFDVSAKIEDLVASGYSPDSAIIKNYKENYAAVAYGYDTKVQIRKKQLQIAALFGPFGVTDDSDVRGAGAFWKNEDLDFITPKSICGSDASGTILNYDGFNSSGGQLFGFDNSAIATTNTTFIERIPVNDFTYLKELGLIPSLDTQKSAMLHSSDFGDTTLPMAPNYLTAGPGNPVESIPELSIAPYGETGWVTTSGDTEVSGDIAYIRSLDDEIVTKNLLICYNFLESSAVVDSSSTAFGVRNYAETGVGLNAKLVGNNAETVFPSGVSIPYLTGSLFKPERKYGVYYSYLNTGSYVRLPNNYRSGNVYPPSQRLDDLLYNQSGWTMDFWVHAPNIHTGMEIDHRFKLLAANENCGVGSKDSIAGGSPVINAGMSGFAKPLGDFRTKGMVIGWRDVGNPERTTQVSGLQFVVAPTVAQDKMNQWGRSICLGETVIGDGASGFCRQELGFIVDASASTESGYSISSVDAGFTHLALACNYGLDKISMYVNSEFLASANISTSFDTKPGQSLSIPSLITETSWHDTTGKFGERLYQGDFPWQPIFTPWILGGGFTDGLTQESPPPIPNISPNGFLGANTNENYYRAAPEPGGGPVGQYSDIHSIPSIPGLGGYSLTGTQYEIPRSGLDGFIGSFKMYTSPLTTSEVLRNYNAQRPYFEGIKLPNRLL